MGLALPKTPRGNYTEEERAAIVDFNEEKQEKINEWKNNYSGLDHLHLQEIIDNPKVKDYQKEAAKERLKELKDEVEEFEKRKNEQKEIEGIKKGLLDNSEGKEDDSKEGDKKEEAEKEKRDTRLIGNYIENMKTLIADKKNIKKDYLKNRGNAKGYVHWFLTADESVNKKIAPELKNEILKKQGVSNEEFEKLREKTWRMIMPFEKKLFKLLKEKTTTLEELRKFVKKNYGAQIDSFDNFYDGENVPLRKILWRKKGILANIFKSSSLR